MIQGIYVDKKALGDDLAKEILRRCPGLPAKVVSDRRPLENLVRRTEDPVGEGKKYLWLTRRRGPFVKPCPCTPGYVGCNYFIINNIWNCPLDCTYCILQHYLDPPLTTVFVNLDDLWKELDAFTRRRGRFFRIGTGELADSLALEPLTRTARKFISYFRSRPNAFFEFKTKTLHIDGILDSAPAPNIVVSWSLNTERIAREEELGAPPVRERLEAARRVSRKGFPVGFHFDPLILYPGWENDYGRVIEMLFRAIPVSRIGWISLGSLRFPAPLKPVIERRFPRSKIVTGELVPGKDGKLRYFKPLRLKLYRKIASLIREEGGGQVPLYFCMEDVEIWERVLLKEKRRKEEVELLFSPRVSGLKSID